MSTVAASLDIANPNELADLLRRIKLGTHLSNVPRTRARAGLTSLAAQPHDIAATIHAVNATAGTPLAIVLGAVTPDAGEVLVTYDADGVPTLTFAAAVTGYTVCETPIGIATATGERLADVLAETWTGVT